MKHFSSFLIYQVLGYFFIQILIPSNSGEIFLCSTLGNFLPFGLFSFWNIISPYWTLQTNTLPSCQLFLSPSQFSPFILYPCWIFKISTITFLVSKLPFFSLVSMMNYPLSLWILIFKVSFPSTWFILSSSFCLCFDLSYIGGSPQIPSDPWFLRH